MRQEIWRGTQFQGAKQYVWDVNDRLTKVIDAMTGPVDYTHDALGNLAAASYADGKVDLRMPDAVGNLFRSVDRTDRKYGPAGQLLESRDAHGVTTYAYDPEGNLMKKVEPDGATWTYEWNGAGMLTRVVRPNGRVVEFRYDPLARRTAKKYRGKTTRWIWDGNVPLHELLPSLSLRRNLDRPSSNEPEFALKNEQPADDVIATQCLRSGSVSPREACSICLELSSPRPHSACSTPSTASARCCRGRGEPGA